MLHKVESCFKNGILIIALGLALLVPTNSPSYAATELVTVVMEAEPNNLDPAQYNGVNAERVVRRIFEGLTAIKPGGTDVIPWLATSWEISSDATEYIFNLRKDVKFQDGTPFNAKAVEFSIERPLIPEHPYYKMGQWAYAPVFLRSVQVKLHNRRQ